jgi:hypothetical protein
LPRPTGLIEAVPLKLPDNVDLSKATVIGRNHQLRVFSGDEWHRFPSLIALHFYIS